MGGDVRIQANFQPMRQLILAPVPKPVAKPVAPKPVPAKLTGRFDLRLLAATLTPQENGPLEQPKIHPFVYISINEFEWRSNVSEEGGHEPTWPGEGESQFSYFVTKMTAEVVIECRDFISETDTPLIGSKCIPWRSLAGKKGFDGWIKLFHVGKEVG